MRLPLLAASVLSLFAAPAIANDPAHPVVVELFQSQGCSSCPPALANVNAIAGRPDVLALTFAVTYWDQLGWKDTFAKPAFTARQWDYSHNAGRANVSTPQVIVNGRQAIVGSNPQQLVAAIRQADRGNGGPSISRSGETITIGSGAAAQPATVWIVRYDPHTIAVPIRAGENGGRTLPHRNVVRSLDRLGSWTGRMASFAMKDGGNAAYRTAILVQQGTGGAIIAASRI